MLQLALAALAALLIAPSAYAQDTMQPVLVDFIVDTPLVDTSGGDAIASLTVRVQDDLSGVALVQPSASAPTGGGRRAIVQVLGLARRRAR